MGRDRSEREPNLGNRVDDPTIHSADPLIFPLPKTLADTVAICGRGRELFRPPTYKDCTEIHGQQNIKFEETLMYVSILKYVNKY